MDYIALNHQALTPQPRGVFYNHERRLGGIRYYQASKSQVEEKAKEVIVRVNPAKSEPIPVATTPKPEAKQEPIRLSYKKTKQKLEQEEEQEQIASKHPYSITIKGKEVDLAKEGIKKAKLNRSERQWLIEAQNYFLTVRENGKAIGSAKEFTKMEILEALWSTAETVGIDPKRFLVQVFNESRFNPYARGLAGERGIGQFKKTTAKQYGYDWDQMTDGIDGFAHQAKASADFIKTVGEVAYNGKGPRALRYQNKISSRLEKIELASS